MQHQPGIGTRPSVRSGSEPEREIEPLVRKLERFAAFSREEKRLLAGAVIRTKTLLPNEDLVRDGQEPTECHVVLDGMLCRYKLLPEGKRQIIGFQVAGDLCGLGSLLLGRMDYSVAALTPAKVAALSHGGLRRSIETHPWIGQALWRDSAADAAISREWLVNTGRRSAYQRMAHLLCELKTRLDAVGKVSDGRFAWPVTQAEVADALGLSAVHVNRMLQHLRGEGLIATKAEK